MLKLYISVLKDVPSNMVPVLVAHSVLSAHIKWFDKEVLYNEWLTTSYAKVVLKVNRKEFNKIATMDNIYEGYENTVLNGVNSCAVILPREQYPNVIKFAKLWGTE